jgi:hypothetical protein
MTKSTMSFMSGGCKLICEILQILRSQKYPDLPDKKDTLKISATRRCLKNKK